MEIAAHRFVALSERMRSERRGDGSLPALDGEGRDLLLEAIHDRRSDVAGTRLRLLSLAASLEDDAELDARLSSIVKDEADDPRARLGALNAISRADRTTEVVAVLDQVLHTNGPAWLGLAAAQILVARRAPGLDGALRQLETRLRELGLDAEPSRRYLNRLVDQYENPMESEEEFGIID